MSPPPGGVPPPAPPPQRGQKALTALGGGVLVLAVAGGAWALFGRDSTKDDTTTAIGPKLPSVAPTKLIAGPRVPGTSVAPAAARASALALALAMLLLPTPVLACRRAMLRAVLLLTAVATVATLGTVGVGAVLASDTTVAAAHTASRARVSHVDTNATAVELLLVECGNGGVSLGLGGKGDETETARAAGLAVLHDNVVGELTIGRKGVGETVVGGVPREVSNVNFGGHLELDS